MNNIYKIQPRLDTKIATEVEKEISSIADEHKYVILDFSECVYMSSMGIRILIKTKKELIKKQGELYITHIAPMIKGILDTAGMSSLFSIKNSIDDALQAIAAMEKITNGNVLFQYHDTEFEFVRIAANDIELAKWDYPTLAGFNEVQFALGKGCPADELTIDFEAMQTFVATENCTAFFDSDKIQNADFRVSQTPEKTGMYLSQAYSYGTIPTGNLYCRDSVSLQQFIDAASQFKQLHYPDTIDKMLFVILQKQSPTPTISMVFIDQKEDKQLQGIIFALERWIPYKTDSSFNTLINQNLTIDNIIEIKALDTTVRLDNPSAALFLAKDIVSIDKFRLEIESEQPLDLPTEFLARRIYNDSKEIIIKKLHGGFSAQTFQVDSYDADGRRLRPTVMKTADRNMIERESDRCVQYAVPYIMNNCAHIIGTEFFGNQGALRYNFVGIGGDKSQLKWVTDYYLHQPYKELEPIFDKIFNNILQPWYGQAIKKEIHPYLDHDPTLTFFACIYDVVAKELNISPETPYIYIEELGREMLNPYRYLKYTYPASRDFKIDYYECICHGDLNMQNILVDETMNVYVIDFSETKVRSAISDFARLEAIFLLDNAPVSNKTDYLHYASFLTRFYESMETLLPEKPDTAQYTGHHTDIVNKNTLLTHKMRQYAYQTVHETQNIIPYCFALLEWILPVVAYGQLSPYTKRLSMIISGLLCEKITKYRSLQHD